MSTPKKFAPIPVHSAEALQASVADTVSLRLRRAAMQAELDTQITSLQKAFSDRILAIDREIDAREAGIYAYCSANRETLFGPRQSIDTLTAVIGFRRTPPRVEKLGRETWDTIAKRVAAFPWGAEFIRDPEPELNKDAILAARARLTTELAQAGIEIRSDETFYITPHAELAPATIVRSTH